VAVAAARLWLAAANARPAARQFPANWLLA
jgi:hypothetical protein